MDERGTRISRLVAECADQGVRRDLDLWPRIQAQAGATLRVRRWPVLRSVAMAAAAVLALALTMALVPSVRAAVESVVQRLGLAVVPRSRLRIEMTVVMLEPSTVPRGRLMSEITMVMLEPPAVPRGGLMSREEIERQAPFQLRTPVWLPEGLALAGGHVSKDGEKTQVYLEYRLVASPARSETPWLMQSIYAGPVGAPPLLPAGQEVVVEVRGQQAIYVHGGWRLNGRGDPRVGIRGTLRWHGSLDSAWLTWKEGDLTYLLQARRLELDLDQMIRIAESLQ